MGVLSREVSGMSDTVVVEESGAGRYQQSVQVGMHRLIADEPASVGGNDAGPAPYDYVLAGLGACTSMTLRMYAERKAMALRKVRVSLALDTVEQDGQRRQRIERRIAVDGELTPEQRARLLEIANKCPVHRSLSPAFLIETRLV